MKTEKVKRMVNLVILVNQAILMNQVILTNLMILENLVNQVILVHLVILAILVHLVILVNLMILGSFVLHLPIFYLVGFWWNDHSRTQYVNLLPLRTPLRREGRVNNS